MCFGAQCSGFINRVGGEIGRLSTFQRNSPGTILYMEKIAQSMGLIGPDE